jgi:hypothetical protein
MMMRRVRDMVHATGVRNINMGIRAWNSTINISHEQVAAKERTNLCTLEEVVLARQFNGDRL